MKKLLWLPAIAMVASTSCEDEPAEPAPPIVFDMSVRVAAGEEVHVCQFVKMPSEADEIFVTGGTYETSSGTHHFLLFRTDPEMPEQVLDEPFDCYEGEGAMQYERGYVSGGQLEHDEADFPPGLGLPFAPGEVLLMQSHIVNASGAEAEATVHVELRRAQPGTSLERVGTFRFYNPFIYVPPNGSSTAAMRCPIPEGVKLITAGGHMHSRGIAYRAFADRSASSPTDDPFYTTNEWQHPDYYAGIVDLPAGAALRFECDYENPTDLPIVQGLSATEDEMCMLSGFYYPAVDPADEICTGMDSHGTGDRSCAQTNSCIQLCDPADLPRLSAGSADVGACFQKCIVEACPNVTATLFPQLLCSAEHCEKDCEKFGATCSACVQRECKAELDACQALSCDE